MLKYFTFIFFCLLSFLFTTQCRRFGDMSKTLFSSPSDTNEFPKPVTLNADLFHDEFSSSRKFVKRSVDPFLSPHPDLSKSAVSLIVS